MDPPPVAHPTDAGAVRWVLQAEVGRGALASVHRALQLPEGAVVAAKILHPRHARDPIARTRFSQEVELARALAHPNLVRVYGACELEQRPALIMEFVDGPPLSRVIAEEGALPVERAAGILRQIAAGLAHAHERGVIHRDLKPANVLLARGDDDEVAKIADFGMARATSLVAADRRSMSVVGTPEYMAPECVDPLAVDPRADLYALGCIAYELLTGTPPFRGQTAFAILTAQRDAPIPRLREDVPRSLRELVTMLLAKHPGDRVQSADAVVRALDRLHAGAAAWDSMVTAHVATSRVGDATVLCPSCATPLVPRVPACFHCGLARVRLRPGPASVIVTGPGSDGDKLAMALRHRLLQWIEGDPDLGLRATSLSTAIPRVPFVLVRGVDSDAAAALCESLRAIGLESYLTLASPRSESAMFNKAMGIAWRAGTPAVAISAAPMLMHPFLGLIGVPLGLTAGAIIGGVAAWQAGRSVAERADVKERASLGPQLAAAIDRLRVHAAEIAAPRHREALRAVTARVLALHDRLNRDQTGARSEGHALDAELGRALSVASLATVRLDQIERLLATVRFEEGDAHARRALHERDQWAGRLLGLTGALADLASRAALALARQADAGMNEAIEELRLRVETVAELQAEA